MQEVFGDDPEDKKEAVSTVRDDEVREDRVGMAAAGTEDPGNRDCRINRGTRDKIYEVAHIGSVDAAGTGSAASRTDLSFSLETVHKSIKQGF